MQERKAARDAQRDEVPHWPVEDVPVLVRRFLQQRGEVAVGHVVVDQQPDIRRRTGVVATEHSQVPVLHLPERLGLFPERPFINHHGTIRRRGREPQNRQHGAVTVTSLEHEAMAASAEHVLLVKLAGCLNSVGISDP
uniref:Uncharacterized protein n=1 Tax=Zea mays TaxID=4577 RepID=C4J5J1_MAIZE|nr:unknown [Zea mays]